MRTKGRGLSVCPPDRQLWISWQGLGKLSCICPLCEQRAVPKNGVICREPRRLSSSERSWRTLGKQSAKAESHDGDLALFCSAAVCVLSLNHTSQRVWPPPEAGSSPVPAAGSVRTGLVVRPGRTEHEDRVQTLSDAVVGWPWGALVTKSNKPRSSSSPGV